jgi:hypothetical protein
MRRSHAGLADNRALLK